MSWFHNYYILSVNIKCYMLSVNISDTAIINIKNVDYGCIIHNTSRFEAINLLQNSALKDPGYI